MLQGEGRHAVLKRHTAIGSADRQIAQGHREAECLVGIGSQIGYYRLAHFQVANLMSITNCNCVDLTIRSNPCLTIAINQTSFQRSIRFLVNFEFNIIYCLIICRSTCFRQCICTDSQPAKVDRVPIRCSTIRTIGSNGRFSACQRKCRAVKIISIFINLFKLNINCAPLIGDIYNILRLGDIDCSAC